MKQHVARCSAAAQWCVFGAQALAAQMTLVSRKSLLSLDFSLDLLTVTKIYTHLSFKLRSNSITIANTATKVGNVTLRAN